MENRKVFRRGYFFLGVLLCSALLVFDQFTKWLAINHLKLQEPFVLIKGVFELHYLENRGAAFGLLQNQLQFLIPFSVLLSFVFIYLYAKLPFSKRFLPLRMLLCFFLSGALGNLIDRVFRGFVVDFFYFKLIDFPIFNLADIYITCSCVVFAVLLFAYYKEEDFEQIHVFKRNK